MWSRLGRVACVSTLLAGCAQLISLDDFEDATGGAGGVAAGAGTAGTAGSGGQDGGPCSPGAVQACYTGDPALRGIGACQEGEQTCRDDGSGFGECQGDTLPATEDCAMPPDEDCDGFACSRLAWHRVLNTDTQGYDLFEAFSVGVHDASGDVVVAGDFAANLVLDPEKVQADGVGDLFIARMDAAGQTKWLKSLKAPTKQSFRDMVVTDDGGLVLAAVTPQAMTVDGKAISPGLFFLKLSADGNAEWVLDCGGSNLPAVRIASAGNGLIAVRGKFTSTSFSAACKGLSEPSTTAQFVGLIGAAGNAVWMRKLPSSEVGGIIGDAAGNVIISGSGSDGFAIDSFSLSDPQSNGQGYIAKLAQDGKLLWGVSLGAINGREHLVGLEVGAKNEIYAIGTHTAAFSVQANDVMYDMDGADYFAAKLDSNGSVVWARRIGDAAADTQALVDASLRVGRNQDLVVSGNFEGTLLPPTQTNSVGATADIFVGALSQSDGSVLWGRAFTSPAQQSFSSLAVRDNGVIHVAGSVANTVSYGGNEIKADSTPGPDYFVAQIEP